jgi:hypothetical protein
MKTAEIIEGMKTVIQKTIVRGNPTDIDTTVLKEALEFIKPWAELETGFEGIKGKLENMIPQVNVEIALTVDIGETREDETIITDLGERIQYLDTVEQYDINLTGAYGEDDRIVAFEKARKDLSEYYENYKDAVSK